MKQIIRIVKSMPKATLIKLKHASKQNLLLYFLAFMIPVVIILYVFKKMEIYPFGEMSLLNMDLWAQYFPMFMEQYGNRLSMDSNLYSWGGALGFHLYAQSAYYTNSLFNYIFMLFSREHLIDVLDFIILLKFGLSSLMFAVFLKFKYKRLSMLTVACSVAYALSAYTLAFINQTMWFDAVVFFPLILIGLERLVHQRKAVLFSVMLALTMVSSFYISFSICIFLVLYFIVCMVQKHEHWDFHQVKADALRFMLYGILAAGMSAFVLLPVYATIQTTVAATLDVPSQIKLYHSFTQYLVNLLPTTALSHGYGVPNVYSGAFVLLMIPLFIGNEHIENRHKITLLTLLGVLYFSMNLNLLDYVWHGFHFPNQLPGRWTFMFASTMILVSYESLLRLDGLKRKTLLISLFNVLFILSLMKVIPEAQRVSDRMVHKTMLGMLLYAGILFTWISVKQENIKTLCVVALSLCMILEVGLHATTVLPRDSAANSKLSYQHADLKMEKIVAAYDSGENDLYRMEILPNWTYNPGQLYGYKGMTYYSSTMTGAAFNFYKSLGFRAYAPNVSTSYNPYSPITNALLNLKYVVDRNVYVDVTGLEYVETVEGYDVLENQYHLPFAFMADHAVLDVKLDSKNFLENQEKFLSAVVGEDVKVFKPVEAKQITSSFINCEIAEDPDWKAQHYLRTDKSAPVELTFTYVAETDAYVYFEHNFKAGTLSVTAKEITKSNEATHDAIRQVGFIKTGETVVVNVKAENVDVGVWGMRFYTLDEAAFKAAYDRLTTDTIQNVHFETTKLTGTLNLKEAGLLYTTIPYDAGWTVKSNGEKLKVLKAADYLIAVELKPGVQTIDFEYHVPGLFLGSVISVLSLVLVIGMAWRGGRKVKDKKTVKDGDEVIE